MPKYSNIADYDTTVNSSMTRAELIDHLIKHVGGQTKQRHDQEQWIEIEPGSELGFGERMTMESCGTTACLAGEALLAADQDIEIVVKQGFNHYNPPSGHYEPTKYAQVVLDGEEVSLDVAAPTRAAVLLGLTPVQAEWFFAPHRTKRTLLRALKRLRDGKSFNSRITGDDLEWLSILGFKWGRDS